MLSGLSVPQSPVFSGCIISGFLDRRVLQNEIMSRLVSAYLQMCLAWKRTSNAIFFLQRKLWKVLSESLKQKMHHLCELTCVISWVLSRWIHSIKPQLATDSWVQSTKLSWDHGLHKQREGHRDTYFHSLAPLGHLQTPPKTPPQGRVNLQKKCHLRRKIVLEWTRDSSYNTSFQRQDLFFQCLGI